MASRSVGHALVVLGLASLGALAAGCSAEPKCEPNVSCSGGPGLPPAAEFESDLPASSAGDLSPVGAAEGGTRTASPASAAAPAAGPSVATISAGQGQVDFNSEAARAISEADIVQLDGDRLFALSRTAGLAVVDASDPKGLALIGRYRELPGNPFEMYLRDGVAILMFSTWGQYMVTESGDYEWVSRSKVVSLDVSNPAQISVLGTFDVPGTVSDSRIVGDVLYIAAFEDEFYCWQCERNRRTTTITSLGVADPRAMRKIEALRYSDTSELYSWGRSITVTDKRMYVAGPESVPNGPVGSTIQVIDISSPSGDLVEGAVLQARGRISSRWQMDEYDGVFRVISQPGRAWGDTQPPMLQTFKVVSSNEFQALARLDIVIPAGEALQSARFDGERGYLITAERQDPLFTLDLKDPAAPRVVGELEMPGFIYHMEPRGERLLGLGFDQRNPEGSITVSLFDVSDLATPKMLSRVNFGGDWGSLPQDQDRIHKVFRILAEEGLILVPFTGYERGATSTYCGGKTLNGVQLVDYANDTLRLRGATSSTGQARRALVHDQHVLSVSDERVEAFDISDRSAPKATSQVVMANNVQYAARLGGDHVVRVTKPAWDGRRVTVETVEAGNAEDLNRTVGQLALDAVFAKPDANECADGWSIDASHAEGSRLYLVYSGRHVSRTTGLGEDETGVLVVDTENPATPKIVGRTSWVSSGWYRYYGEYDYGGFGLREPYLWHGNALSVLEQKPVHDATGTLEARNFRLRVVDLRNPKDLSSTTLPLDAAQQYSGLSGNGNRIFTTRFARPVKIAPKTVRFYIDSFDVSDPRAPKALPSVNVPGVLVHYDAPSGRAITSQLRRVPMDNATLRQCYERFANNEFSYPPESAIVPENATGSCVGYVQSLHLVRLNANGAVLEDTLQLADDQKIRAWSAGTDRLFATLRRDTESVSFHGVTVDCIGCVGRGSNGGPVRGPVQLLVLGGFASGSFSAGRLTAQYNSGDWWGLWDAPAIYADGDKAMAVSHVNSGAAIIDASDLGAIRVERTLELYGSPLSVEIRNGTALLALAQQGVQWANF